MGEFRKLSLFLLYLCCSVSVVGAQPSIMSWPTLSGYAPVVIARGGFSGLYPDSSYSAYTYAVNVSLPEVVLWCDVQLTRDGGICFPDVKLNNECNVESIYGNRTSNYVVDGVHVQAYYTIDFTTKELELLNLKQGIHSRTTKFDGMEKILTIDSLVSQVNQTAAIWLNIQHDGFYMEHNMSMKSLVDSVLEKTVVSYISSPKVEFLMSMASSVTPPTKLIFRFLALDVIEPSTNQSYGSLMNNLTFIKTFASGVLVPKYYILPLDSDAYLLPPTSLVFDAHKAGLEIHASGFAADLGFAYDYNYDPVYEYLSYIDNGNFSVDGMLSDFPLTPSATIDCFSHMSKNGTQKAKFLIITSEGSSGQLPGCTDMAYHQAIEDGADVIDCPVQMSLDGVPFCMGSINLMDRTTVAESPFANFSMDAPELEIQDGILAFNLTWSQIQTLTPSMYSPYASNYRLFRNPRFSHVGSIVQLSQFLEIAYNASSISGVLISIENAQFLTQRAGLSVVQAVVDTLNAHNMEGKNVHIQSGDSGVLSEIGKTDKYELVYRVDDVSNFTTSAISDIRKFSTAVVVYKSALMPTHQAFLTLKTNVTRVLQDLGMHVYVQLFNNEFVSLAYDFLSDPYLEINTYLSQPGVEGVVTAFPATSSRFRRNWCLEYEDKPKYMSPVEPGVLISAASTSILPPAEAPNPILYGDVPPSTIPPRKKSGPKLLALAILVILGALFVGAILVLRDSRT